MECKFWWFTQTEIESVAVTKVIDSKKNLDLVQRFGSNPTNFKRGIEEVESFFHIIDRNELHATYTFFCNLIYSRFIILTTRGSALYGSLYFPMRKLLQLTIEALIMITLGLYS